MTRSTSLSVLLVLGLLLHAAGAPSAVAQQTRTLTIDDGQVHIDGERLPPDQWPASLDLSGVQARYQFVGIQRPVVEIDGRLFAVTDRLVPVSEDEIRDTDASVILRDLNPRSPTATGSTATGASATGASSASALGQLRAAQQERRMAQQEYLSDVQRRSRQLYERLLRERRMEQQTFDLARTIRSLPEGPERQAQVDTLRATLNRIFDLKQENRRREIEQLQRQIMELQQSLRKREQMREKMIDRRLQQLIDSAN